MKALLVMLFYTLLIITEGLSESKKPRRSVSFPDVNLKQFKESDFDSLSSLMVRDDIGQLVLGARGKVITLSLDDITDKTSEEMWTVSSAEKDLCQMKGKTSEECENFIRILHTTDDGNMFVCGTNAFNPACTYMNFTNGKLSLEKTMQDGRGKVPFDPYQEFASFMDGNTLFSATSSNFLGTEMVFQRHGLNPIKTEKKLSWLKEPTMISIINAEVSKHSGNNEDDNVFLFFTENAVEEPRSNIRVSRIARVCKSDLGGQRILQNKWTSFLKARLDCPFGDAGSPALVQDVFFLQDKTNWTDSIFYATFTSNPEPSSACIQSAVCAYKLSDIRQVFKGTFLTESNTGSWDTYTGEEPYPYPGSCIDDEMQANGVMTSLNLSDTTLLFVKSHPLMKGVVTPITGKPLLVQASTQFSKIVVDQVTSLDGQHHHVIFFGTNSGWLQKAVRFGGEEGRIVEELQLFQDAQFIDFLQLSSKTGQLYSGARNTVVQVDVRGCSHYLSCDDCLLARDPYCGWDYSRSQCDTVVGTSKSSMIQSLMEGNISLCPSSDLKNNFMTVHLVPGIAQFLPCSPSTNLPVSWRLSGVILHPGPQHLLLSQGLIIWPSSSDAGLYTCETVETVKSRQHRKAVVQYLIKVQNISTDIIILKIAVTLLACFAAFLICLIWKYFRATKLKRVGSQICNNCQERSFHQYDQANQRLREQSLHHRVRDAGSEGAVAAQAEKRVEPSNDISLTVT